jgi:CheY-like chemotaxis protein
MDIQLSGINGVEALKRLRADPVTSSTPFIAITASVMTQDRTRIMAAWFDGFQGKPISIKELLVTVRENLDKRCSTPASHLHRGVHV